PVCLRGGPRHPPAHAPHHRLFVVRDVPEAGANRVVAAVAALSHAAVTIGARGPGPGFLAGSEARIVLGQDGDNQSDTGGKRQDAAAQIATHANHFSTCAMDNSWGFTGMVQCDDCCSTAIRIRSSTGLVASR